MERYDIAPIEILDDEEKIEALLIIEWLGVKKLSLAD